MAKVRWKLIRVRESTHAALQELIQRRFLAAVRGQLDLDISTGPESLDAVVQHLIEQKLAHNARSKASKRKKGVE